MVSDPIYYEAGRLMGEYDASGTLQSEHIWLNDLPMALWKATPVTAPPPSIESCYTPFAALERLEVRSGRPGTADWEWGLGSNTQSAGSMVTINNINWASGTPVKFQLSYDGAGQGTITLMDATTNATLATRTYNNTTNPLRVGNAIKLYVKQSANIGTGVKVRAKVAKINGTLLPTPLDLETTGDNLFNEKSAYAETPAQPGQSGMVIEGEITMTWGSAAFPNGSRLGVTINAGQAPCVAGGGGGSGGGGTTSNTPQLFYVHSDLLGTPRAITRPSDNAVVWRWDNSDPFGNNAAEGNPNGINGTTPFVYHLRFPGQYYDVETGTSYNYNRDYDSSLGRYIQSDPIGLGGGLNTYGYALASPLEYSDPFGLKSFQCKTPLHALNDAFGPNAAQFALKYVPYGYHQYSCVVDSKGNSSCGGQDRSGNPFWSPGKPSDDKFDPENCKQTQPDNECFETCLTDEWKKKRPRYGIPLAKDCQDYDDDVNKFCRKKCRLK